MLSPLWSFIGSNKLLIEFCKGVSDFVKLPNSSIFHAILSCFGIFYAWKRLRFEEYMVVVCFGIVRLRFKICGESFGVGIRVFKGL